jgi:hypothetical protein
MQSDFPPGQIFAKNMQAIGYTDLEGRPAFKMALHKAGDRWYLYTATFWHPGLNIVEVTDPANPRFVRFIPGPSNTWTLQVQIADGIMVTSEERIMAGWGDEPGQPFGEGFIIWDLADPEDPKPLGKFKTGSGGTHRNYYDGGRYVYATGLPDGYDGHILQIVDIADPANPREVGRWWREGQWLAGGEKGVPFGTLLHGGAYVRGDRAYLPYSAGGFVVLDISDKTKPRMISDLPFSPPFQSFIAVHTAIPLTKRDIVVVNSEAIAENCDEPLGYAGIVDIKDETNPRLSALFPLPQPPADAPYKNFCEKGGRFGPHNQHQWQNQDVLMHDENLVYLTYFNAGLRVYDISDERLPREVAYFIPPDPLQRRGLLPKSKLVNQTEDVLVDNRGNIFISDKNHGIYVLRLDRAAAGV